MTPYQYGKDTITFLSVTGEVLSPNTRQTLKIRSSSSRISSSTRTDTYFWLKTDEGQECEVSLPGYDLKLREGHRVTLIIASITKGSRRWGIQPREDYLYIGLVNCNTSDRWKLNDASELRDSFHLRNNNFALVLLHIVAIIGISFLLPSLGAVLAIIYGAMSLPWLLTYGKFNFDFIDYHFFKKSELNAAISEAIANA